MAFDWQKSKLVYWSLRIFLRLYAGTAVGGLVFWFLMRSIETQEDLRGTCTFAIGVGALVAVFPGLCLDAFRKFCETPLFRVWSGAWMLRGYQDRTSNPVPKRRKWL